MLLHCFNTVLWLHLYLTIKLTFSDYCIKPTFRHKLQFDPEKIRFCDVWHVQNIHLNDQIYFFPDSSCGTHLSIFRTFPMAWKCFKIAVWLTLIIFASSREVWDVSSSMQVFKTLSSIMDAGLQCDSFSRDSSLELNIWYH